jgi:tetratricopeptide (TPR) repeat protein
LAVKKGEFEWAEQFLQDFKKYLPARERENLFKYNLAMFYFRRNDYPKAMQLLQEVTLKDVLHNLDARRVLMRIYYELGEFDALDSLLESFKIFLHRQKDLSYHRQSYLNLIKFVKKLLQTNLLDKKEREILRGQILETTELTERDWLLGQLA